MACTKHSLPWEMTGKVPAFSDNVWELYGPDDWTQAKNLAAQNPQKLASLQQLFQLEASLLPHKYTPSLHQAQSPREQRLLAEQSGKRHHQRV
jgi:hypothetical protein